MKPTDAGSNPSRSCPICGTQAAQAPVYLEERIDDTQLNSASFASRKAPEFMSHHMVTCPTCDLAFADRPPPQEMLAQAYHLASFDSAEEADDAARAYIAAIRPLIRDLGQRRNALEIGTGTGIFLEHLRAEGFADVLGIEPSRAAIDAAPAERRSWIREGMFDARDFAPGSFDLVCCFMTLEHVRDPGEIARSVRGLLRDGGLFVTVTHDRRSLVNRVLGRRSPIVDIEHMQLFSRRSIEELLARSGFSAVRSASFANRYTLRYWLRLTPLPDGAKKALACIFSTRPLRDARLRFNVGNTIAVGRKPINKPTASCENPADVKSN